MASRIAAAFVGGAATTYLGLSFSGAIPLWAGPEYPSWVQKNWSGRDAATLLQMAELGGETYQPMQTTRSWTMVDARRLSYFWYWLPKTSALTGLIHFGPDTEGLPRKVATSAAAAAIELSMIGCATKATGSTVGNITNIQYRYHKLVPLGKTVFVECKAIHTEGTRAEVIVTLKDPDSPTVYAEGLGNVVGFRPAPTTGPASTSRPWWKFWS
eukprot:NODE_7707_length_748_cov_93.220800_g7457_i0.p1 GENE.NODE_7707_length_748_cov_93.220800_g7457_i0~~NODE_7707_length_748_cov_93.220800_g7457_i0.p1  ORF type:complete len:232 (+),score=21.53 NODE_7707_length_748_cov_93.220800_g7457_i0:58-696(+)